MTEGSMTPKEFRRHVGRELKRVSPKNNKKYRTNGYRLYRRILRTTYDILGIGYKEMKILHSGGDKYIDTGKEARIHLQGIVDWCEFLLTLEPPKVDTWALLKEQAKEVQRQKTLRLNFREEK